jgi:hypothetical protein
MDALAALSAYVVTAENPPAGSVRHTISTLIEDGIESYASDAGEVDLAFVPAGTDGYDDLSQDAVEMDLKGLSVRVASLADVIRSKQAANRPKDQRVLPTLREILASRHAKNHRAPEGASVTRGSL